MFSMLLAILPTVLFSNFAAAQSPSLSVVCVAGQCVQGLSNTTLGATLSAANAPTSLHLLPGTYTSTTNPQLLHRLLTSSGASLSPFPGFENVSQAFTSSSSLPLDLAMSPGLTTYAGVRYSGQALYTGFQEPSSSSDIAQGETSSPSPTQMTASSLTLSDNVYMIVGGSSNASDRVVLWDSVPDVTQLPLTSSLVSSSSGSVINLNSISLYSTTCNPTCSSNGVCSPLNNTCLCAPGFTGSSCESCAPGFFGPTCQACPGGCDQCDEGIQGTGRCLKKTILGKPEDCGCVNGQCGNNGQCVCNAGWQDAPAGEKCAKCQDGFFLTSTGDCQVCQAGCSQCADTTGTCIQCKQGFSLNSADNTKCDFIQKPTSTGQTCPSQSFSDGDHCSVCSSACRTCNGPTSNDCVLCASGRYLFNGNCVGTNGDGVCEGTTGMMGNNLKGECDACPSKCTSCKIPGFSVASTIDQIQCTGCLPGFVLSQGKCVESCPSGTFLSPQDNLNCIACDSSCSTCADSADFCLTCNSPGQLAFNGKCISACPSNTFTSNSTTSCTTCHGDCASCSGAQFNQCTSCTPNRPVLKDGRCLPTCAKGEFFDKTSGGCRSCDSSCATCSDSGQDACLSCSEGEVLREGKCVKSDGGCDTLQGLGVCLEELVIQPPANPTTGATPPPTPSITGIADPTVVKVEEKNKLQWWQVVLMVLGGFFCLMVVVVLWRRQARKKRAERTKFWAAQRGVLGKGPWWKRIFTRNDQQQRFQGRGGPPEKDELPMYRDDMASQYPPESTVDGFIGAYADEQRASSWERTSMTSRSMFSEMTGERRKAPEPRAPLRELAMSVKSLRTTTIGSDERSARSGNGANQKSLLVDVETEAEKYKRSVRERSIAEAETHPGAAPFLATEPFWMQPTATGNSNMSQSRNPFRA